MPKKLKYTPADAINDLEVYINKKGFTLSDTARGTFLFTEELGCKLNTDVNYDIFLAAVIKKDKNIQALIIQRNQDPEELFEICIARIKSFHYKEDYDTYFPPYSSKRRDGYRETIVDSCIAAAQKDEKKEVTDLNIIEALLNAQDELVPPIENMGYLDQKLHVPYNTLSHILGSYNENLWIKFDDIRSELPLSGLNTFRKILVDSAPNRLKTYVLSFTADHPNYHRNCFLIMPFTLTPLHKEIHLQLKDILEKQGFNLLRADDKYYADDVLSNIETYVYGCRFAVAVHERIINDNHNANVALEVGYFMGLKKPVCLLKEKTVKALPSDLQGRLYVEFDGFNIRESLELSLTKWLKDKRLI